MTVNLGKAIKEARFKRGMTQEDLAKMLCVSQSKLSRIKKNCIFCRKLDSWPLPRVLQYGGWAEIAFLC